MKSNGKEEITMCKYCNNDTYYSNDFVKDSIERSEMYIRKGKEGHNMMIDVPSNQLQDEVILDFDIKFCPMCGRKLNTD